MNHKEQKRMPAIPKIQPVKFIERSNGTLKGYAVNTFQGLVKNYNEDRVSIIMNITKPNFKGRWPRCSYFGVFDGHGGNKCSDFLKENMHRYITQNSHFPHEPIEALKFGFKKAEHQFLSLAQSQNPVERSGSCALVLLIIDETCYVANVGDCRAILSANMGKSVYAISKDHKPDSQSQKERIFNAGGKIYQSSIKNKNGNIVLGPYRIQPGKLSVSRSFGDIQAKLPKYEGNSKVLIAKPEITYFQINSEEHDFLIMCSDGVYDKLSNEEVAQCFWNEREKSQEEKYQFIGSIPSRIIERSMEKLSMDNLTCLVIVFEDNGRLLLPQKKAKLQQKENTKKLQPTINQGENQPRMNNTAKILHERCSNQQAFSARSPKFDQNAIQSNRNNRENIRLNGERSRESNRSTKDNLRQHKQQIQKIIKRKSSANLMAGNDKKLQSIQPSHSLNSSISAKMLQAGSKIYQKGKREPIPQKVNITDLLNKKKSMDFIKKQSNTLWKQMITNPKPFDKSEKVIRF